MKSRYCFLYIIISFFIVIGCAEETKLKTIFEPQIFISGYLVNTTDYITVKIQETVRVDNLTLNPINDARVSLFTKDSTMNATLLTNEFIVKEGAYTTFEKITTHVGNHYWIEIVLQDGTTFISDEEVLKPPVILNEIKRYNGSTRVIFRDLENESNFYLIRYIFYNKAEFVSDVFELTSDALFDGNNKAFHDTQNVSFGDETHVSVLNLNFNTYQFYLNSFSQYDNQLDYGDENNDPGQLFLPPPAHLYGNIINTSENRRALGFFGVFSYSYKTKYF